MELSLTARASRGHLHKFYHVVVYYDITLRQLINISIPVFIMGLDATVRCRAR